MKFTLAVALLVTAILFSLSLGPSDLSIKEILLLVLPNIWHHADIVSDKNILPTPERLQVVKTILWSIRCPRTIVAACCGGSLALAGVMSQGLFRNPLASPSVLGIEAGAILATVITSYFLPLYTHFYSMPLAAALGATLSMTIILILANARHNLGLGALLLSGVMLSTWLSALTSLVISLSLEDYEKAGTILRWLMGGFNTRGWDHVQIVTVTLSLGLGLCWLFAPKLDVLALGEDVATSLSVDVSWLRWQIIFASALLIGGAIAAAGALPFISLIVPHLSRLMIGPKHRPLLLLSVINGMTITLIADLIARLIRAPAELEVGVVTGLIGAPFFLWLYLRPSAAKA